MDRFLFGFSSELEKLAFKGSLVGGTIGALGGAGIEAATPSKDGSKSKRVLKSALIGAILGAGTGAGVSAYSKKIKTLKDQHLKALDDLAKKKEAIREGNRFLKEIDEVNRVQLAKRKKEIMEAQKEIMDKLDPERALAAFMKNIRKKDLPN